MRKLPLLVGAAIGYVLGTRAGRERYEQLAQTASKFWSDPRVQQKVEEVKTQAPEVASKLTESAKTVTDKARTKVSGDDGDEGSGSEEGSTANAYGPGGDRLP
jgi:hypothetical protein